MMIMKKKRFIDMTVGSPVRLIVLFALPLIVGNLFQQLYSIVDAAIVSRYVGINAFAAIGATGWVIWWLNSVTRDCSNAVCIVASVRIGSQDKEGFRRVVVNAVILMGALCAIIVGVLFFASDKMMQMLNVSAIIYEDARIYLRIFICALPVGMMFHVTGALLRAAGNSSVTSTAMTTATIVNIALDLLFVLVFHWNVTGVGIATLLSQFVAMTIALLSAIRTPLFSFGRSYWKIDHSIIKEIIRLLIPMMLNSLVITTGGLYVLSTSNAIGTHFIAGTETCTKIFSLLEAIIMAIQTGVCVFVGQNLGADQPHRIRSGLRRIMCFSLLLTLVMIGLVWAFRDGAVRFFLSEQDPALFEAAYSVGVRSTLVLISGMVIMTPMYLWRSSLQTIGHPNYAMLAGVFQVFARVLTIRLLRAVIGEYAIYLADVMAWIVSLPTVGIPFTIYIRRLCRAKNRLQEVKQS